MASDPSSSLEQTLVDAGATIASTIASRVFAGIGLGIVVGIAAFFTAHSFGALETDGSVAKYLVWGLLPLDIVIAAIGLGYAGSALGYSTALDRVLFESGVVGRFVGDLLDRVGQELVGRADAAEAINEAIEAKTAEDGQRKGIGAYASKVARKLKVFIYRVCAKVLLAELADTNKLATEARTTLVDTIVTRVKDLVTGHGRRSALISAVVTALVLVAVTAGVAMLV